MRHVINTGRQNSSEGTVTSVGLAMLSEFVVSGSPITDAGTILVSRAPQGANAFLAGPVAGSSAVPTFRSISPADLSSVFSPALLALFAGG